MTTTDQTQTDVATVVETLDQRIYELPAGTERDRLSALRADAVALMGGR